MSICDFIIEKCHTLTLTTVLPQIHPFTFGDESANAGDTVGVQCMIAKGDSPINISWRLNGNDVKDISGISVTKINQKWSTLSIDSVSLIHTGIYTCLANNPAGNANYSTELAVNGNLLQLFLFLASFYDIVLLIVYKSSPSYLQ